MQKIIIAIFALSLTGCATQHTVDMAQSYNDAYVTHTANQQMTVDSKAKAIKDMMTFECDEDSQACGAVKAMAGMIAAEKIAGIKGDAFTLEKHATDVDAQIKLIDGVSNGIPFLTIGVVAVKAINDDNGTVNNNADDGSSVTNSYEEDHTTNFGDESTVSSQPDQDNSVMNEAEAAVEE